MDQLRVLIGTGQDQHEPDLIHAPSPRAPRHLKQIGGRELHEFLPVEPVAVENDHRPRRKIHSGRHGGGGENRVEARLLHQLFKEELPVRELPAVVRSHPRVPQYGQVLVVPQKGVGFKKLFEALGHLFPLLLPLRPRCGRAKGNGLLAVGPGLEEEDGRQQVRLPQCFHHLGYVGELVPGKGFAVDRANLGEKAAARPEGAQFSRGEKEKRIERHRPLKSRHPAARRLPEPFEPVADLLSVPYGGGKEKQPDPRRQVDENLLPHHSPVLVPR